MKISHRALKIPIPIVSALLVIYCVTYFYGNILDLIVRTKQHSQYHGITTESPDVQQRATNQTGAVGAVLNEHVSRITSLIDLPTNFNYSHKSREIKFTILWFNPSEWIQRRTKFRYQETCEYNNCQVTFDRQWLHNSSAVIFGLQMHNLGSSPPISPQNRNPDQIWIFNSREAPVFHVYDHEYKNPAWNNMLNWSMTFNFDADVFEPYGTFKTRQTVLERDYDKIYAMKNKTALWFASNCESKSKRQEFVDALQRAGLDIDIYGRCGSKGPTNKHISEFTKYYKFYLSLENSFCKYYVTEKVFERMGEDVISVIRGGADYSRLLPNGTYIDVRDFANASSLVHYLLSFGSDKQRYIDMMRRKDKYYTISDDHFGYPYAMCELCKKLNHPDGKRKVYTNLVDQIQREGRCVDPQYIIIK